MCENTRIVSILIWFRFLFTRIDTIDVNSAANDDEKIARKLARRQPEPTTSSFNHPLAATKQYKQVKQLRGSVESKTDYCYVDLEAMDVEDVSPPPPQSNYKVRNRILNPIQRTLDEAIWSAYTYNDFSNIFLHYKSEGAHVNFQRPSDGLTALMAASFHNRADVVDRLLQMNASVKPREYRGQTAADIALVNGHGALAQALDACVSAENDRDYVYDVYCVDSNTVNKGKTSVPVVHVSSEVEEWLAQGDLIKSEQELLTQYDSDWSEASNSEDSNDENYHRNDYPDEEDSEDDSETETSSRMVWHPHAHASDDSD